MFARRNDGNRFMVDNKVDNIVGIIASVGDHVVADTPSQQCFSLRYIMSLTGS
jgi:hypothetical protein